jgi:dihydroorotate dehydrogenase (NAD+) catalytic subunit
MTMKSEKKEPNLSVVIGGLRLKNPVMTASGTFGYGKEFDPFVNLNTLGAIVVKGLSLKPSPGNPPERIVETAGGMLNSIGLENVGWDAFVKEKLPFLRTLRTPVIVNIYGHKTSDYAKLAARINDEEGIAAVEVNISCPNVKKGGIAFGTDPKVAFKVIQAVKKESRLPVIAKLSPNVTDITVIAGSVEDAGADAISLINTITGMAVDIEAGRPRLANIIGGLSGPAIKPIALRMVWQVSQTVKVPVIGIGGIMNAADALEFLIVGATAIQVGTANLINPSATQEIIGGLKAYLLKKRIPDINDLIGTLKVTEKV